MTRDPSLDETLAPAGPAAAPPPAGGPRYHVVEAIDADTVIAEDAQLGRAVVVERVGASGDATRFLRAVTLQARLEHPAIAPVHEIGHDAEGRPFVVMKRLVGRTLTDVLAAADATPQRLLRAFVDVCIAIDFAHARGVVHRNLAPARVLLGDYGEVYVVDWGSAQAVDEVDVVAGEQADPAGDVYALGALLFELLAREPLGTGATSPMLRCPTRQIPPELDGACLAALAPRPADRPGARALAERVQRYLDGARDIAARRASAAQSLELGRSALAVGDRVTAIKLLHRAQWLDPTSTEAPELMQSLVDDRALSPRAEAELAAVEAHAVRQRSGRALVPLAGFFLALPFILLLEIRSYAALAGMYATVIIAWTASFLNWRFRRIPMGILLAANLMLVIGFSRFGGPFLITPVLVAALVLPISAMPFVNARPWFLHAYTATLALAVVALEAAGVLAPTWAVTADAMVSFGTIFAPDDPYAGAAALLSNVFALATVALYARRIARDRRDEQRRLHIQEWHLRQLLPRSTPRAARSPSP